MSRPPDRPQPKTRDKLLPASPLAGPEGFEAEPQPPLPAPAPARALRRAVISNTLIVMLATIGSRGLGLLREVVIAAQFGTSGEINAYVAAFRIPDLLYLLLIGGALGSALIPVFSRFIGQGEPEKAWRLANAVINTSLVAIVFASFWVYFVAPQLVRNVIAPELAPDLQATTVNLTRLLLLQPLLLGLGGIAMAILNGTEHFLWPAIAPLFYNGCIILGALFLAGPFGVYGIAIGVIVGAGIYFLVQLPILFRLGLRYRPKLDWRAPGLAEVLKVLGPRLFGQAAFQFNFFIITNLASRIGDGSSISALNYAFQLFMLPHGIFAMSVATVAFPAMSRQYGAGDMAGVKTTLTRSLRQIIFFALPASLGLALLARPIVAMIFQLGKFGNSSTALVSEGLIYFSFGLLAYGVVEIVTRAFYALQDTRTPVFIAVVTVALNIFLSSVLGRPQTLATGGLALGLALATTFEMVALLWLLYRKIGSFSIAGESLLVPLVKIFLAADFMAALLWSVSRLLNETLADASKIVIIGVTLALIGVGAVAYGAASLVLGVEELRGALNRFLRR